MTHCRSAAVILITTMSLSAIAAAVAPFHLTTSDLRRRDVQVKAITETSIVVFDLASKREQTLPIGSIVSLSRSATSVSSDGMYVLRLRDGQRIVCKPTGIKNDAITCATRELGERTYPVADVASLAVATLAETATTPGGAQDDLRLANGDQLRGIVAGADAKTVTCQTPDGQSVAVDWTNVRAIRFAETQPASTAAGSFLVTLASGTRVRATKIAADGASVTLTVGGDDVRLLAADLVSIEHLDGDALMLAWMTPASTTYLPYFPSSAIATPAFAVDQAAAEVFGATTAIRVRPKTSLRWTIAPAFGRLRARVVIPPGNAFADVTVRVLDGDRIAFERKNVKSGAAPLDVDVPLSSGGTVSLETDYGEGFDVQDRVVWLDAAVLKEPASNLAK